MKEKIMQYFVCQISQNLMLGAMTECPDLNTALNLVREIVKENGVELTPEVEHEIVTNYGYVDINCDWSVQVGIVTNDDSVRRMIEQGRKEEEKWTAFLARTVGE